MNYTDFVEQYIVGHRDILQGKAKKGNFYMCLSISFHKSESFILFKLNKFVVAIGKKTAPGELESSWKKLFVGCLLQDVPVPDVNTIKNLNETADDSSVGTRILLVHHRCEISLGLLKCRLW